MHVAPLVTAVAVGFDTLRANPLRTILSTLGVIIGVSALVAVLSVGDGMERSVRAQIAQTTDLQAIAITAKTHEEVDGQSFPLANPVQLSAADAKKIRGRPFGLLGFCNQTRRYNVGSGSSYFALRPCMSLLS